MPVGLTSERARQRERTVQIRLLATIERAAAIRFAREFNRLGRELGAMLRASEGTLPRLDDAIAEHGRRLTVILERLYVEVGDVMASRIRGAIEKCFSGGLLTKAAADRLAARTALLVKQGLDQATLFQLAMRQFIEGQSGLRIEEITATTLGQVRDALTLIDVEGLGEIPGAKIIEQQTGGVIGRARAMRIARTEGHTGSQFASQTQITQLGVEYVKRWVSVQDQRTRSVRDGDQFDHKAANGQKRKRDEQYEIKRLKGGSEKLNYPGDPKGSAGNIINCRCIQVYEVIRR